MSAERLPLSKFTLTHPSLNAVACAMRTKIAADREDVRTAHATPSVSTSCILVSKPWTTTSALCEAVQMDKEL